MVCHSSSIVVCHSSNIVVCHSSSIVVCHSSNIVVCHSSNIVVCHSSNIVVCHSSNVQFIWCIFRIIIIHCIYIVLYKILKALTLCVGGWVGVWVWWGR